MKTLNQIKTHVEQFFNVEDIAIRTSKKPFPDYRKVYFKIAKVVTKSSLANIGDAIDRDHTSVLNQIGKADNLIQTDREFREMYSSCLNEYEAYYKTDDSLRYSYQKELEETFSKLSQLKTPRKLNYKRIEL